MNGNFSPRLASFLLPVFLLTVSSLHGADFTVHEWGTFTSYQTAQGEQLAWSPSLSEDLPGFVHDYRQADSTQEELSRLQFLFAKGQKLAPLRMETPVIYFHAREPFTANLTATFHHGNLTEWYPVATRWGFQTNRESLVWNGIQVQPRITPPPGTVRVPEATQAGHYHQARTGESAWLTLPGAHGPESEEFLFYRGLGHFPAPLEARLNAGETRLQWINRDAAELGPAWVLHNQDGNVRWTRVQSVPPGPGKPLPLADLRNPAPHPQDALRGLAADLVANLTEAGLTSAEARAMVATWEHAWLREPGLRILYLLPAAWVDRRLPLAIEPRPREVRRVFVGRLDLLKPSALEVLQGLVRGLNPADAGERQTATRRLQDLQLGRFTGAALQHAAGPSPSPSVKTNRDALLALAVQKGPFPVR